MHHRPLINARLWLQGQGLPQAGRPLVIGKRNTLRNRFLVPFLTGIVCRSKGRSQLQ